MARRAAVAASATATPAPTRWSRPRRATTAPRPRGPRSASACGRWCTCPSRSARPSWSCSSELGADLRHVGADVDEAKDAARRHAEHDGLPFFEDGAEPAQFEGYAAIGREIVEQLGEPPALTVVPVGNGALLIGVARGLDGAATLGVVPKGAPVMALSVEAGRPVECDLCDTFADGWRCGWRCRSRWRSWSRWARRSCRCPSGRSRGRWARSRRPASASRARPAAALAALDEVEPPEGPIVLIVTGHNIDDELHRRAVEDPDSFPD